MAKIIITEGILYIVAPVPSQPSHRYILVWLHRTNRRFYKDYDILLQGINRQNNALEAIGPKLQEIPLYDISSEERFDPVYERKTIITKIDNNRNKFII